MMMRRFSPPTTPGQHTTITTTTAREENDDDDDENWKGLSEFERMRERRIAKNMQRMREMGLEKIAAPFRRPIVIESASSSSQTPRKVRPKTKRFVFLSRRASVECFLHLCRRLRFLFPSSPQSSRAFAEEKRRPKLPLIDKIRSTEKESCFDTGKSATTHVSSREEDKLRRRRRTDERRK